MVFRIPEIGPDQSRALGDVPSQLSREKVVSDVFLEALVVDAEKAGRGRFGNAVAIAIRVVVRGEEPEAVLEEVAAEVRPVIGRLDVLESAESRGDPAVVQESVVCFELLLGAEALGSVVGEDVAMKLVATGLCDDVDDAAGGPAKLGLVAAGLDLDLLDELTVDDLALHAAHDAVRIDAVDDELVFRGCRPIDRQCQTAPLSVAGVFLHARLKADNGGVVAAQRKLLHDFCRVVGACRRVGGVHDRRCSADDDLFLLRDLEHLVGGRRRAERHVRRLLGGRETCERTDHLVGTGWYARDAVVSAVAGDRRARSLQRRTRGGAVHSGQGGAGAVGDGAGDVSRGLGECQASSRRADDRDRQQRQEEPSKSTHRPPPPLLFPDAKWDLLCPRISNRGTKIRSRRKTRVRERAIKLPIAWVLRRTLSVCRYGVKAILVSLTCWSAIRLSVHLSRNLDREAPKT